jgi:hypothetical protein
VGGVQITVEIGCRRNRMGRRAGYRWGLPEMGVEGDDEDRMKRIDRMGS